MKALAERYGADQLVVVFGVNEPLNLRIMVTTFRDGDPSWAGPLAGIGLGLACYHILELRDEVPVPVWEEQMAMKELEIGDELAATILATMRDARGERAPGC